MARTRTLYFYVGDFEERLEALLRAAEVAEKRASKTPDGKLRLGASPDYVSLRQQFNDLQTEAKESADKAVVREVSTKVKRKLRADHPVRLDADDETRKLDASYGFNVEAAQEDLTQAALVEPEFKSRAGFDEWFEDLGAGAAERVYGTALALIGASPDPKYLPELPLPRIDETSD